MTLVISLRRGLLALRDVAEAYGGLGWLPSRPAYAARRFIGPCPQAVPDSQDSAGGAACRRYAACQ